MPFEMPPKIEQRNVINYVAIATKVLQQNIGAELPILWPEIFAWLGSKGVAPSGAPFIRYLSMGTGDGMSVEVGVPVATPLAGTTRITAGRFPAGRYAVLTFHGNYSGLPEANMAIHNWAEHNNSVLRPNEVARIDDAVHAEFYPTDPQQEPEPAKWISEIVLRMRD